MIGNLNLAYFVMVLNFAEQKSIARQLINKHLAVFLKTISKIL